MGQPRSGWSTGRLKRTDGHSVRLEGERKTEKRIQCRREGRKQVTIQEGSASANKATVKTEDTSPREVTFPTAAQLLIDVRLACRQPSSAGSRRCLQNTRPSLAPPAPFYSRVSCAFSNTWWRLRGSPLRTHPVLGLPTREVPVLRTHRRLSLVTGTPCLPE